MRSYPEQSDKQEVEELNAESWQIKALKVNPSYMYWGNYEDYMCDKDAGWRSPVEFNTYSDFNFGLDELNECVNFYFEVYRESTKCIDCDQSGYNPATKQLADDWYDFERTGRRWDCKITDDEVMALVKHGRLNDLMPVWTRYDEEKKIWLENVNREWVETKEPKFPTAEEVNNWNAGRGIGHDAINRGICIETRGRRLGVYGFCECCNGKGYVYTEPKAKLGLQLWYIHPRKGASRGVYIKEVPKKDLKKAFSYLKEARDRNQNRFSLIP